MTEETTPSGPVDDGAGPLAFLGLLIGGACLLVAALGAINTLFDLDLALTFYGSGTDLPDNWASVAGLGAVGVIFIAISLFGSFVAGKFTEAKGKPLQRAAILIAGLATVVAVGRAVQLAVLSSYYGSMLASYAKDGNAEAVKDEMEGDPDPEDIDRALGRAADYDHAEVLAVMLDAGADLMNTSESEERRSCVLGGSNADFIQVALDRGITPERCVNSHALMWRTVDQAGDQSDERIATIVANLAAAGWSPTAHPEWDETSILELESLATRPKTKAVLVELVAQP